jgi:hypothetical protein
LSSPSLPDNPAAIRHLQTCLALVITFGNFRCRFGRGATVTLLMDGWIPTHASGAPTTRSMAFADFDLSGLSGTPPRDTITPLALTAVKQI